MSEMSGETFGKYTLERVLGRGGMATVYLATEDGPSGFKKKLCLKKILPHLATEDEFVGMFLDEARTAARLSHPNLVQIFGLGEEKGVHYIVMEYVNGVSLARVIRTLSEREELAPVPLVASLISKVAAALDYAHHFADETGEELGLVHRDVSPDNILISRDGAVKLIDFGIAKANTNESKTVSGAVKGKFRYMSPEQIRGQELDGRSDIFSLGLVLYELLSGQQAFDGGGGLGTVNAILTEEPKPLRTQAGRVPAELEKLVLQILEKDRTNRPDDCRELERALEQVIRDSGQLVSQRDLGEWVNSLELQEEPVADITSTKEAKSPQKDDLVSGFEETLPGIELGKVSSTAQTVLAEEMLTPNRGDEELSSELEDEEGVDDDLLSDAGLQTQSRGWIWGVAGVFVLGFLWVLFGGEPDELAIEQPMDELAKPQSESPSKVKTQGQNEEAQTGQGAQVEGTKNAQVPSPEERIPSASEEKPPKEPLSSNAKVTPGEQQGKAVGFAEVTLDWSNLERGSTVILDGRPRGKTPMKPTLLRRKVGTRMEIEVKLPNGKSRKFRRKVAAGENQFVIR